MPLLSLQLVAGPLGGWHWLGLLVVALGQALRLASVGHIGRPSRTRDESVSRLVDTGPYALCRNPLYVGNALMWFGLGLLSGPLWGLLWLVWMALQYTAIVRWEEANLVDKLGDAYVDYLTRVPRWFPSGNPHPGSWSASRALSSERSTLIALVLVLALFAARAWIPS